MNVSAPINSAHRMAGNGPNLARRSCAAISNGDLRVHTATSNETEISHGRVSWQTHRTHCQVGPLAYVRVVEASVSLRSELRGRLWSNHFGWQSLFDVGHAPIGSIRR